MKSFILAVAFLGIFGFVNAGTASAQNLSGTWVGADGGEVVMTHSGKSLQGNHWAGPTMPNLRGTSLLTGNGKTFEGTWQNRMGEWTGSGTMTITVIDANTTYVSAQGFVYYRGNKTPWSGAGYYTRKVARAALPDISRLWKSSHHKGASFTVRRSGDGYAGHFQGPPQHNFAATAQGNTFRVSWSGAVSGSTTASRVAGPQQGNHQNQHRVY